jgi:hypothetical protein
VGEEEILAGLRLVAIEAGRQISVGVGRLVGTEGLIRFDGQIVIGAGEVRAIRNPNSPIKSC